MAKTKAKDKKPTPNFDKPRAGCRPFSGFFFFVLALLILVALWHFDPSQSPQNNTDPEQNPVGNFGVALGYHSFKILGGAGWLLAIASFYLSYMFLLRAKRLDWIKGVALLVCIVGGATLLSMQDLFFAADREKFLYGPGGMIGSLIYGHQEGEIFTGFLHDNLGVFGSALVLAITLLGSLLLLVTGNLSEAFQKFFFHFGEWKAERADRLAAKREARQKERERRLEEKALKREASEKAREEKKSAKKNKTKLTAKEKLERELDGDDAIEPEFAPSPKAGKKSKPAKGPKKAAPPRDLPAADPVVAPPLAPAATAAPEKPEPAPSISQRSAPQPKPKIIKSETLRKAPAQLPQRQGDYLFPTLDLLEKTEAVPIDDRENHEQTADTLIKTLATFGVEATVDEIHVGPVITRFDILPAPGTKVSKIQGLENDIAMALKALAVRILAPVPGKGCVGVEIPNRQPQPVSLREIIESEDWVNSRAEIPIGLGKDVSGKPLVADLTKMPHLLIAGSTGSGKTVCINSIIASLLYHASPDEVRFIMVDPKIVEMKVFNDLPHMLIPVVTEPKKVPGALKWLLNEMQRRYEVFAAIGVRNISGFHSYRKKEDAREKAEREAAANAEPNELDGNLPEAVAPEMTPDHDVEIPKSLPYIVCIIDELADLMMVAPAEIETGIARLAQLARAAGIHLILATQRPSVNVITGVIKANLPSRISFKVASKVDSRTILDTGGADTLIGRGDMLFLPPGSSRLIRSQGAFVSDEEISDIVEFLKRNGPPAFAEDVQRQIDSGDEEEGGFEGGDEGDELFHDALDVLRSTKRASTSMLQRRLRIGYNRAARIMELMEERGIVGPENGSSPREILVDLESL